MIPIIKTPVATIHRGNSADAANLRFRVRCDFLALGFTADISIYRLVNGAGGCGFRIFWIMMSPKPVLRYSLWPAGVGSGTNR